MKTYITSTPDKMGGAPVIAGTRIPIEVILYRLKEGYSLDTIHEMYSWVDKNTLEGAINVFLTVKYLTTSPQMLTEIPATPQKTVNRNR